MEGEHLLRKLLKCNFNIENEIQVKTDWMNNLDLF